MDAGVLSITATDAGRRIRAIIGASSGNLVEWYDFYAYAFTSIYFTAALFPAAW
jgi:MHS family alpha-ketoglutarate permease-like MFS transporter